MLLIILALENSSHILLILCLYFVLFFFFLRMTSSSSSTSNSSRSSSRSSLTRNQPPTACHSFVDPAEWPPPGHASPLPPLGVQTFIRTKLKPLGGTGWDWEKGHIMANNGHRVQQMSTDWRTEDTRVKRKRDEMSQLELDEEWSHSEHTLV